MTEIYKHRPSESRIWEMDGEVESEMNQSLGKIQNLISGKSENSDLNEDSIKKFIEYLKYLKGDEQDTEDKD